MPHVSGVNTAHKVRVVSRTSHRDSQLGEGNVKFPRRVRKVFGHCVLSSIVLS
jgi:hypothetical protein